MGMIGCWPVEGWKWLGINVWAGAGKLGECMSDDMKQLGLQPDWLGPWIL